MEKGGLRGKGTEVRASSYSQVRERARHAYVAPERSLTNSSARFSTNIPLVVKLPQLECIPLKTARSPPGTRALCPFLQTALARIFVS